MTGSDEDMVVKSTILPTISVTKTGRPSFVYSALHAGTSFGADTEQF